MLQHRSTTTPAGYEHNECVQALLPADAATPQQHLELVPPQRPLLRARQLPGGKPRLTRNGPGPPGHARARWQHRHEAVQKLLAPPPVGL